MKLLLVTFTLLFSLISADTIAREKGRHVVIPKTGTFELDNASQSSARTFTTESDAVFGVEYEWHLANGLSIGGEIFHFENDFIATNPYTLVTDAFMFNLKYHFNNQNAFQPYIGVGLGAAVSEPTGETFVSEHIGRVTQLVAGMTYKFEHVGIYAEYKKLRGELDDDFYYYTTSSVDVGGEGILIGVSVLL